ncbi:multidrug resistance protein MdtA [Clostridium homopropionicum DSM 5847]|uniref:Multidrug resistance protein MdtA n=1 Tax=Clostridium homopropionicum DSM 5847 TaxID=1121318 RepID=A0A0L6ZA13_9CLOT|nr:efflux RND transporter periplasmic adaptor subunit [Clostridium homopropionicum]KOA19809.1 multidrug resistance protein MdtA [Clostridium homopropionicum DSM 5847]SFF77001.1 RND family efflux transporter, MFP subunit [Clostridium homopropionicum]
MKRRLGSLVLTIIIAVSFTACSAKDNKAEVKEKVIPVKTMKIEEEGIQNSITYTGIVNAKEVGKYSFKSAGKISNVYVEKGQKVAKGQKLVSLDTKDLSFSIDAAKAQMDVAQAQYDKAVKGASEEDIKKAELTVQKAQEAYDYSKNTYEKVLMMYNSQKVTKEELDKAKLEMNIKALDLDIANETLNQIRKGASSEDIRALKGQLDSAKINYESKKKLAEDSLLTAEMEGYIVDVLSKPGEIVAAGYPVIAVRGESEIVNIGLSQDDMQRVKVGTNVMVNIDDKESTGKITRIDQVPDKQSRTYNAEIELSKGDFPIGAIGKTSIILEESTGMLIPINAIMHDTEDYVYTIVNGKAEKKPIKIEDTLGDKVKISGVSKGDILVIEGIKSLSSGVKVIAQQ